MVKVVGYAVRLKQSKNLCNFNISDILYDIIILTA